MNARTLLVSVLMAVAAALTPSPAPAQADQADQAELERKFEAMVGNARLVGQFSVVGANGATMGGARPDEYAVSRLERDAEGRWIFNVSMTAGPQGQTIPVPVTVEWAGSTPMITMTEQTIPGLGTFSARVLFHDGLYAGTWKHGQFGGHMWGKIEPPGSIPAPVATPGAAPAAPAAPTTP
jgi:hypothetical protein